MTIRGDLSIHKRAVHEGVKYPCGQCNYQATTQGSLDEHKRAVHEGVKYLSFFYLPLSKGIYLDKVYQSVVTMNDMALEPIALLVYLSSLLPNKGTVKKGFSNISRII